MTVPTNGVPANALLDILQSNDINHDLVAAGSSFEMASSNVLTRIANEQANTSASVAMPNDGISFIELIKSKINHIDQEEAIINDAVTNPRPHSARETLALQNTLQQFAVDTQVSSKVVSILSKGVDGLVHTQ